ncbi:MAG: type IV pilus biogenesis/stability protein PilW [Gammaproteobacteria bacterium]|uniref:type IV pilus biogenesis/stability protein PilW n=1 Tax=Rhodoferax sp. TaxID=50421 RepID=UPI0017E35427|nr:type IV pilus biogenesis/stability protein PilW [Rhodoferax sp.]MBU3899581.1 type IV pilus biogenesis/stability protein PilW [Gammaproteobacteria bacterium]MBA3059888.1 type IV pilus biogenesis/stability protein PilW [Rhodoferax sp.]MBU3998912.1 type IV pilus biogenesis/stability protein PilW [Gammaproteobacteria bacterium]MBU4018057.1 type IV pilus biogenesis/stability protein PilW [Gammaproteobacteria bacterium]MBU4080252.1 type IV pilus biogenesis/stability protein PilW [Gammaproteobacte
MTTNSSGLIQLGKRLLFVCLLVAGLASALGCASKVAGVGPAGGKGEMITASDEPDARRRARIRLELAVGYFEQGQTTIALDELKQSIASDPTFGEAYNLRGLIYMRLNDRPFAEESFRKALAMNPQNANVVHNLGWLLCQQARYPESLTLFSQALANPQYGERAKTLMAQGLCQMGAGRPADAEASLLKSYEFDAGNPVTAYNLATLLFQRGDYVRAQFYVRRLNNSELANAESLWLGIKVERRMNNRDAMLQLATQLQKRFPQSRESASYARSAFDE